PFAERLITLAKEKDLSRYRRAISLLGDRDAVRKLFDVLGPRFKSRPGGYTRIIRLPKWRLGDNGRLAIIELVERTPQEKPAPEGKKGAGRKKGGKEKAPAKKAEKKAAAAAS
ncbi:MAG: bL17 family ribosomal protein, partial [Planctomycetota bacterium]